MIARLYGVSTLVGRVGTEQDHVRASGLEGPGRVSQAAADLVPLIVAHELLEVAPVETHHHDARRVRTAEAVIDALVQQPVIDRGGFPAGPSDEADYAHNSVIFAS